MFNISLKRSLISSYNVIWTLLEKLTMILLCFDQQADLTNQSVYNFMHENEKQNLYNILYHYSMLSPEDRAKGTAIKPTVTCQWLQSSPLLLANGFHSSYRNLTFFSIIWKNTVHIAYFAYSSVKVVIYVWGELTLVTE